ncbi:CubicO group peptidase (beta-lactamase class C family) [Catenuloplanes nepalensis]|uniref:CubicO group peptidase (Beta-lactamase class C family) n=1 Tax=Catenuloplanes nepalensis TaxID=587533 RepID=A0ABT9MQ67_9ACTN|nr:serine hydrolase domain-containing protein [Catenuloplanes nepalensis]MDP9793560.1 CubicO group peptidase (beta-lactamase class C family) [Catenuloplanes nepalensis]
MHDIVARSPAPATAVSVFGPDEVFTRVAHGTADLATGRPVGIDDWWDLASLTKVLVTLPEVLAAVPYLETPLEELWTPARGYAVGRATIRALLTHTAGLPASVPFFRTATGRDAILAAVLGTPLGPPDEVYSDLGFMLLGQVVEELTGRTLGTLAAERTGLRFGAPPSESVATEHDPWRGRLIVGEVHDENAAAMGGVAGQAGAFGTLALVTAAAQAWLRNPCPEACTPSAPGARFGLGWVVAPRPGLGSAALPGFGHTGYVGNRLWLSPSRGLGVLILANRVHPTREGTAEPYTRWCSSLFELLV